MQDFYNKSLCKESEFMVDNFVIGQQVYRMESSRKDIGDVIKEHFEGVALLYQGDELWHTKNYFLMLTPSDVMYEALIDVLIQKIVKCIFEETSTLALYGSGR